MFPLCDESQEGKDDWTERDGDWNGPKKMLRQMEPKSFACVVVRFLAREWSKGEVEHT